MAISRWKSQPISCKLYSCDYITTRLAVVDTAIYTEYSLLSQFFFLLSAFAFNKNPYRGFSSRNDRQLLKFRSMLSNISAFYLFTFSRQRR